MDKRRLSYIACFPSVIAASFLLLTSFTKQAAQESLRTPPNPEDIKGWEIYPPGQTPPAFTSIPSGPSTSAVASPATSISTFTITIAKRPLSVIFYDAGTVPNDGDAVNIVFNGQVVRSGLVLTSSGSSVNFNASLFRSGINRIATTALGGGAVTLNTVGIIFPGSQVGDGTPRNPKFALAPGQTIGVTVGFPQIAICQTTPRFPCLSSGGLDVFPETAQHVLDALGIPPTPIFAPLKPGRTGNPLRASYPRLLTIDRLNATTRRNQSSSAYQTCPANASGASQDRDEYPPAVFLENAGSAHIKCISSRDNQQAGNTLGRQLRFYFEHSSATSYEIPDKNTIEFVVLN